MKRTILAAALASSLLWSGAPGNLSCTTRSCEPVAPLDLAGQVALVTSRQLVMPRSRMVDDRDCVGFPLPAPVTPPATTAPLSVVASGLLHWM